MHPLWVPISLLVHFALGTAVPTPPPPIVDGQGNGCEFVCLYTPKIDEKFNSSKFSDLPCTTFVYAGGAVNTRQQFVGPSNEDESTHSYEGNLRMMKKFKRANKHVKVLLGASLPDEHTLLSNSDIRKKIARNLAETTRDLKLDGWYIAVTPSFLNHHRFTDMFEELKRADPDQRVMMGLPLSRALESTDKIVDSSLYVNHVLLASEPNLKRLRTIDPLLSYTHPERSIQYNTQRLVDAGLPSSKLIVGLTSGIVKFTNFEEGSMDDSADGQLLPLESECYDDVDGNEGISGSVTLRRENERMTMNSPTEESVGRKARWLTSSGFAGVAAQEVQLDDNEGLCGRRFPMLRTIESNLDCQPTEPVNRCTLICDFQEDRPLEEEKSLCSHVAVSAIFSATAQVQLSPEGTTVARWLRLSRSRPKPELLIDLGSSQGSPVWRSLLSTERNRKALIRQLLELCTEWRASGSIVSWTDGVLDHASDSELLNAFLRELQSEMRERRSNMSVSIAVTPASTWLGRYVPIDFRSVDKVIVQSHRLHTSKDSVTGHHSPLFSSQSYPVDARYTIDGMLAEWITNHNVSRSQIIVSLTAAPLRMWMKNAREADKSPLNTTSLQAWQLQLKSNSQRSQESACALAKDPTSHVEYLAESAMAFLTRDDLFLAFESARSIQMKTTYVSLNGFAGVAFYNADQDDIKGECNDGPFPLLAAISRAQVCTHCLRVDGFEGCSASFAVSCIYKLPTHEDLNPMRSSRIPVDSCSQVIINEMTLKKNESGDAELSFRDSTAEEEFHKLVSSLIPKMANKRTIVSVTCDSSISDLFRTKGRATVATLVQLVDRYSLSGIQLDCDSLSTEMNRDDYSEFILNLKKSIRDSTPPLKCPRTLSLRILLSSSPIDDRYSMAALSAVDVLIMGTESRDVIPQASAPLFSSNGEDAIDTIRQQWEKAGIFKRQIAMELPSHGTLQDFASLQPRRLVGQAEICSMKMSKTGVFLDLVSSYGISADHKWLSSESSSTVTYKTQYAIEHGLWGIAVVLNDDDPAGSCPHGPFPLLHSITPRCN